MRTIASRKASRPCTDHLLNRSKGESRPHLSLIGHSRCLCPTVFSLATSHAFSPSHFLSFPRSPEKRSLCGVARHRTDLRKEQARRSTFFVFRISRLFPPIFFLSLFPHPHCFRSPSIFSCSITPFIFVFLGTSVYPFSIASDLSIATSTASIFEFVLISPRFYHDDDISAISHIARSDSPISTRARTAVLTAVIINSPVNDGPANTLPLDTPITIFVSSSAYISNGLAAVKHIDEQRRSTESASPQETCRLPGFFLLGTAG